MVVRDVPILVPSRNLARQQQIEIWLDLAQVMGALGLKGVVGVFQNIRCTTSIRENLRLKLPFFLYSMGAKMIYKLQTDQKAFKKQLRAFINDTGWTGIFKKNVHRKREPNAVVGEDSLGVTKGGQLVRIFFDGKTFKIET